MGQKIYYVLAQNNVKVPLEIVHFKEKEGIVLPILIEEHEFKFMANDCEEEYVQTVDDFFMKVARAVSFEYPTNKVFSFVKKNLDSFALLGYREVIELPQDLGHPILFINRKKVDTKKIDEMKVHELLGISVTYRDIINNESKYWSYYSAETTYFEELAKKISLL